MSFEQYQFAGYGYKITDSEDIDYYWEFFDDEEREEIFCDQNIFYHWLGDTVVFIGFKFGNNLSKDKFIEQLEKFDKEFWSTYIYTLGEARKPLGEPKVMFFTYEA